MTARPGKTLPSVIVGGLLVGAMALGMGTAHAGPDDEVTRAQCEAEGGLVVGLQCLVGQTVLGVISTTTSAPSSGSGTGEPPASDGPSAEELAAQAAARLKAAQEAEEQAAADQAAGDRARAQREADQQAAQQAALQRAAQEQAARDQAARDQAARDQAARQAQVGAPTGVAPTAGLLTPAGFGGAPGGLMTGLPGGAAGFGAYNPGLLLAPLGSPLRTMTGQDGGSPVTTASQVQSMAFDDLPGGPGVPAVVGVLILSALGAFALRHRILARARAAADTDAALGADAATQETATV